MSKFISMLDTSLAGLQAIFSLLCGQFLNELEKIFLFGYD